MTRHFEESVAARLQTDSDANERNPFACGLTGGSTALIFLGALRDAAVMWPRVTLFWGDERAVPPDHPESNYALAERLLLAPLGARAPHGVRMPADNPDLQQAAVEYDLALSREGVLYSLDLLILGVGDDGHVCSLFPGHRALLDESARVLAIEDSPKPPPRRLTLSLDFVVSSRQIWVVVVGPRKLPVLQAAVSRQALSTPLDLVVNRAKNVTIFTDQSLRGGYTPR